MQSPHLDRVRKWRAGSALLIRWSLAGMTGVTLAALALCFGIATHQLARHDAGGEIALPSDPLLGGILRGQFAFISVWLDAGAWDLRTVCCVMLGLGVVLWITWRWLAVSGEFEASDAIAKMRRKVYERASTPDRCELSRQESPKESTTEAEQLLGECEALRRGLIVFWHQAPRCQVAACMLLATAMVIDPWIGLLGALLAVAGCWRFQASRQRAREKAIALHRQSEKSEMLLMESLRLAPLAAMFGLEQAPGEPFEQNLRLHSLAEHRAHTVRSLLGAQLVGLATGAGLLLFFVFCLSNRLTVSAGVSIAVSLLGASMFGLRLLSFPPLIENADAAAGRFFSYLDRSTTLTTSSSPRSLEGLSEGMRLEGVTWEDHRGRKLLNDATCAVPAGLLTSVLSSDAESLGAMVAALMRIKDPLEGRVLYDDSDVRGAAIEDVRKRVSFVAARPMLFTGTIQDNILCGESSLRDHLNDVVAQCGAEEMIGHLPQGLATLVGPLGLDLPDHVTFHIMLMRAVIREPDLLIIEEPSEGDSVFAAVCAAGRGRTVLLLPSRIDSLRHADRVLLLHQGRFPDTGTHADLIQSSDLYRHLNYMRFHPYQATTKPPALPAGTGQENTEEGGERTTDRRISPPLDEAHEGTRESDDAMTVRDNPN